MSSEDEGIEESLDPSELGTKDYWDSYYSNEIENFNDHGDVGDIWFGKAMLQSIVQWLKSNDNIKKETDGIIDLGCGNGWSLISLAKLGYKNLCGLDYSENAIELARRVASNEQFTNIKYQVCNLVNPSDEVSSGEFKVALDKGTYDAISLSPDNSLDYRNKYKMNVNKLLSDDGMLVISSCNWTEHELKDYFKDYFDYFGTIPSPKTFQFGGKSGNDYSTIILKKRS